VVRPVRPHLIRRIRTAQLGSARVAGWWSLATQNIERVDDRAAPRRRAAWDPRRRCCHAHDHSVHHVAVPQPQQLHRAATPPPQIQSEFQSGPYNSIRVSKGSLKCSRGVKGRTWSGPPALSRGVLSCGSLAPRVLRHSTTAAAHSIPAAPPTAASPTHSSQPLVSFFPSVASSRCSTAAVSPPPPAPRIRR
jgi:hypothetical protein